MAKIKLGDMTVNLRNKICEKHTSCTGCPFFTRHLIDNNLCDPKYWSMYPETEVEFNEEELKCQDAGI